jgi:hypothetical protein
MVLCITESPFKFTELSIHSWAIFRLRLETKTRKSETGNKKSETCDGTHVPFLSRGVNRIPAMLCAYGSIVNIFFENKSIFFEAKSGHVQGFAAVSGRKGSNEELLRLEVPDSLPVASLLRLDTFGSTQRTVTLTSVGERSSNR